MSEFYRDWKEAHAVAQEKANRLGLDVALRKTKEYGRSGYRVSLASRNDSDYALAEIVRPDASYKRENPRKRRNPGWMDQTEVKQTFGDFGPARAKEVVALAKSLGGKARALPARPGSAMQRVTVTFDSHSWAASQEKFGKFRTAYNAWDARRQAANLAHSRGEGPDPDSLDLLKNPRKRKNPGTFTVEVGSTHHRSQHVPIRTLQEASGVVNAFVASTGIGASGMTRHFGEVRNKETGKLIARISYNGRAWTPTGEEVPGVSMTFPLARAK